MREKARELIARYRVKTPSPETALADLSGGNVQRAVLARELSGDVDVLIVANPCFGLDFASVAEIRSQIMEQRNRGAAVLLVSEDLDEILGARRPGRRHVGRHDQLCVSGRRDRSRHDRQAHGRTLTPPALSPGLHGGQECLPRMSSRTRFDLLIFDFDGTLCDTRFAIAHCLERALAKYGRAKPAPGADGKHRKQGVVYSGDRCSVGTRACVHRARPSPKWSAPIDNSASTMSAREVPLLRGCCAGSTTGTAPCS